MIAAHHPDVVHEMIDGRAVLVDPGGTELITLNETGSRVWAALDGERDVAALAQHLDGIDPADVEAFVGELVAEGLVVEVATA